MTVVISQILHSTDGTQSAPSSSRYNQRDNEGNFVNLAPITSRKDHFNKLKGTVQHFLKTLDVPFVHDAFDQAFYDDCVENMTQRGWSERTISKARIFLIPSLVIARTAYAHLPNYSTQIYIAIYTTLLIYLDDICSKDKQTLQLLKSFSKVLLSEQPQGHEVLNAIADVLREIPQHYGEMPGSIILSSTLRYITSIVMEEEVPQSANKNSKKFPRYLRELSGVPEAYAMFIFPPSISYTEYIQTLPDMITYICYTNDILSLYKEEIAGEEGNLISLLAARKRISKSEAHRQVTDETLESDRVILELLEGNSEAQNAYKVFRAGYVAFHTCLTRYRLCELLDL